MRGFILGRIASSFARVEERPVGVFRIPTASGDAVVFLPDVHQDQPLVPSICRCSQRIVLVIGRRPCGLYRTASRPAYRLAEIALGVADSAFVRTLRNLTERVIAAAAPQEPTILAYSAEPMVSIASNTNRASLQAPDGTRWSEVTLYLVDGETIAVRTNGGRLQRFHHYDVGLADRRSGKPNKRWRLLEALYENYGEIRWRSHASTFGAFKEQVSGLRHVMQTLFGIHADPFKSCTSSGGLSAAFQALPGLPGNDQYDESMPTVGQI